MPTTETARPTAGKDIDETRLVALPSSPPDACIVLLIAQAVVLLPRDRLEQLAEAAAAPWSTETERIARIDGRRAEALLKAASSHTGADNKASAQQHALDSDAHHLLAHFIEQGQASILCGTPPRPQPHVTVRYLASRTGPLAGRGDILFHLPDDPMPFLVVNWWVA
ncbi:hypothetical protein [Variovorax sp. W6]|uniref:hypothetical protein n=1 Tax=Variovorax sp. W6 TaxID=3093895 RepID=UPI003D802250